MAAAGGAKVYVSQSDFLISSISPEGNKIPKFGGQLCINTSDNTLYFAKRAKDPNSWIRIASKDQIEWGDIVGIPSTIAGIGVGDVYTKKEVNQMIDNMLQSFNNLQLECDSIRNEYALKNHVHDTLLDIEIEQILSIF